MLERQSIKTLTVAEPSTMGKGLAETKAHKHNPVRIRAGRRLGRPFNDLGCRELGCRNLACWHVRADRSALRDFRCDVLD